MWSIGVFPIVVREGAMSVEGGGGGGCAGVGGKIMTVDGEK